MSKGNECTRATRPRVQQRARRHGNDGVRGNAGNVESATYRI